MRTYTNDTCQLQEPTSEEIEARPHTSAGLYIAVSFVYSRFQLEGEGTVNFHVYGFKSLGFTIGAYNNDSFLSRRIVD